MRVLVIEKDNIIRQSLSYFMRGHKDWEVFNACSKRDGVSLFQNIPFDIVLCGDSLPDGNSLELLREWLIQNPKLIAILMTVRKDDLMEQEAKKAGIKGCLEKPFNLKQLEEIIFPQSP